MESWGGFANVKIPFLLITSLWLLLPNRSLQIQYKPPQFSHTKKDEQSNFCPGALSLIWHVNDNSFKGRPLSPSLGYESALITQMVLPYLRIKKWRPRILDSLVFQDSPTGSAQTDIRTWAYNHGKRKILIYDKSSQTRIGVQTYMKNARNLSRGV